MYKTLRGNHRLHVSLLQALRHSLKVLLCLDDLAKTLRAFFGCKKSLPATLLKALAEALRRGFLVVTAGALTPS